MTNMSCCLSVRVTHTTKSVNEILHNDIHKHILILLITLTILNEFHLSYVIHKLITAIQTMEFQHLCSFMYSGS
jgi:hypothetical protein